MPTDVRQFLDSYRDAFNRLDGRAISSHYDLPSMIVHAAGSGVFTTADDLDANNVALCEQYAKDGFLRADYVEHAFLPQGEDFCVVDLAWSIARRERPPQQFNTSYTLARRGGHWKVASVTAYQERRPWREHERRDH